MPDLESVAALFGGTVETRGAPSASRDIYGTIKVDSLGAKTVKLDGGDDYSPCTCMVTVHHGDRVLCHITNHQIVVFANVTVPSVNDAQYQHVKDIAEEADELLDGVAEAAAQAEKTVAEILTESDTASALVDGMQQAATTAGTTLAQIVADADSAASTLADMQDAAEAASTTLTGIYQDAADAQASATAANTHANEALVSLSEAQDVIGVVNWITQHGTYSLTQDQSIDPGKVYYTRTGSGTSQDPYLYTAVAEPSASALSTYYELSIDQALSQFVASHLALTNEGLFVLKDGSSWKTLMKADGWEIRDGSNATAMSIGSGGVDFAPGRQWHVGSNDAYILYTPASGSTPASITIGGSHIQLGDSRTLSELMAQVEQASQDAEAAKDICTISITSTNGTVFKSNTGVSTTLGVRIFTGDGQVIETKAALTSRYGAGAYLQWKWKDMGDADFTTLLVTDPRIIRDGFALVVSPSDISTQAVIDCELIY